MEFKIESGVDIPKQNSKRELAFTRSVREALRNMKAGDSFEVDFKDMSIREVSSRESSFRSAAKAEGVKIAIRRPEGYKANKFRVWRVE